MRFPDSGAVIPQPNAAVEIREVPEPQLEPDSALLAVELPQEQGADERADEGQSEGCGGSLSCIPRCFLASRGRRLTS